jgi:hypothetical protein
MAPMDAPTRGLRPPCSTQPRSSGTGAGVPSTMPTRHAQRTHSRGVHAGDWLDALMILLAIVVSVAEVLAITTPFR